MLQLIKAVLKDASDDTELSLLFANQVLFSEAAVAKFCDVSTGQLQACEAELLLISWRVVIALFACCPPGFRRSRKCSANWFRSFLSCWSRRIAAYIVTGVDRLPHGTVYRTSAVRRDTALLLPRSAAFFWLEFTPVRRACMFTDIANRCRIGTRDYTDHEIDSSDALAASNIMLPAHIKSMRFPEHFHGKELSDDLLCFLAAQRPSVG